MTLYYIDFFKKKSISLLIFSISSYIYSLPLVSEAKLSFGLARSVFSEVFITPTATSQNFKVDVLNPYIETFVEKKFLNNKFSILTEASYTYSAGKDITLEGSYAPYYAHTQLWDIKSFIFGPSVTSKNIKFGIGFGFGRASYVSNVGGHKDIVDRSHGILPLLVLAVGSPIKNSYQFSLKYGVNTMSESDYGYAPYIESSFSYFFTNRPNISEGFTIKYVNWKNPILLIANLINTPGQNSLFFGYEARFR